MGESMNGDMPSSKTLSHISSYPVISDSISTFKSNPYGAKSISVASDGYTRIVVPVLPYFEKPYSYVKPYVAKCDNMGDNTLNKVDEKFPVVKTETQDIKDTAFSYAHWPFVKFDEGRKYVFNTYGTEYKKCGGDGYVAGGKAVITTSLITVSDVLSWFSGMISQKKAQAKSVTKEKTHHAKVSYEKTTSH